MELHGSNFQSWKDFRIDISGLTVLTGSSNLGKSAIFRALRGILRNEIPENFIRDDQEEALALELGIDGHQISVTRERKKSVEYVIDGKPFAKLGGEVPKEIQQLGYNAISIGDFTLDPIFACQHEKPFLLQSGPTELSTILGAFASTEKLEAGKKVANLQVTQKNSEARTLSLEIRDVEDRKAKLEELALACLPITSAVLVLEGQIRSKEAKLFWSSEVLHHNSRLVLLRAILASLVLPDLSEAEKLEKKIQYLQQAAGAIVNLKFLQRVLSSLVFITTGWSEIMKTVKAVKSINEAVALVERKETFSPEAFARQLNNIIGDLEGSFSEATKAQSSIKLMEQTLLSRQRISANKQQLAQVETELVELKELGGLCPKCGRPLEHVCEM